MSARLPPGCEERCPGCRHRALTREESEGRKSAWVRSQLKSGMDSPLRGAPESERWSYRKKVCLRAQWDPAGRWKLGLGVRSRDSQGEEIEEVIDIPRCPVHSEQVRKIQGVLSEFLPEVSRFPLVHVLITGALVTCVLKSHRSETLEINASDAALRKGLEAAGARGLFLNFNPSAGNRVLSSRGWFQVWGDERVQDEAGLWYGPDSFQQLIPSLYSQALEEAREFLDPTFEDSVMDLYSGSGASLRIWKAMGARCIGVELGGEAIRCAERNVGSGVILRGRVSERLPQLEIWARSGKRGRRRLLFANPPRLGLENEVSRWIGSAYHPERIAYLSCSVGTLTRDLSILGESGYTLRKITPYDFFPNTHHVETLALLETLP